MLTIIEDYFGPDNAMYVIWGGLAVAALLVALLIVLLLRRAFSGTYVVGGRNRRPRLAVLDATAVDARRRLVLVRRDETEHLILIGGTTDVVIESGIRPGGMPAPRAAVPGPGQPQRRPAPPQQQLQAQPTHAPQAPQPPRAEPYVAPARPAPEPFRREPEPAMQVPVRQPAPAPQPRPVAPVAAPPPAPEPVVEPVAPASPFRRFFSPKPGAEPAPASTPAAPAKTADDVDRSLEEEMSRLLEEMSDVKT